MPGDGVEEVWEGVVEPPLLVQDCVHPRAHLEAAQLLARLKVNHLLHHAPVHSATRFKKTVLKMYKLRYI